MKKKDLKYKDEDHLLELWQEQRREKLRKEWEIKQGVR